jgi:RNA polymerase sigma factor (sigma-70 family)
MRADESGAFEEFFERFAPVLRNEAARLRIQPALREEAVVECLEETAMSLIRPGATAPDTLAGYLVVSLRRKNLNRLRAEKRREQRDRGLAGELAMPCAIESDPGPSELGARLLNLLTDDERALVTWMSEQVPLREVARWLGVSHAAARQRVTRLRTKLRRILVTLNAGEAVDD